MTAKVICGISVRGAAYLTASFHLAAATIYFFLFLDRLISKAFSKGDVSLDGLGITSDALFYFGFFFPLGVIIFKAVDNESKVLLRWGSGGFLFLQLLSTFLRLKTGHLSSYFRLPPLGPTDPSDTVLLDGLKSLSLELAGTITYVAILYIYEKQLESRSLQGGGSFPLWHRNLNMGMNMNMVMPPDLQAVAGATRGFNNYDFPFEPPPPYSSTNNLPAAISAENANTNNGVVGLGLGLSAGNNGGLVLAHNHNLLHHPQAGSSMSSRGGSVFLHNIPGIGNIRSKNKRGHGQRMSYHRHSHSGWERDHHPHPQLDLNLPNDLNSGGGYNAVEVGGMVRRGMTVTNTSSGIEWTLSHNPMDRGDCEGEDEREHERDGEQDPDSTVATPLLEGTRGLGQNQNQNDLSAPSNRGSGEGRTTRKGSTALLNVKEV